MTVAVHVYGECNSHRRTNCMNTMYGIEAPTPVKGVWPFFDYIVPIGFPIEECVCLGSKRGYRGTACGGPFWFEESDMDHPHPPGCYPITPDRRLISHLGTVLCAAQAIQRYAFLSLVEENRMSFTSRERASLEGNRPMRKKKTKRNTHAAHED